MKRLFYCLALLALCSCGKSKPDNHAKMEQLADRTCRAIDYRKQRFACADQIRFSQDTLYHTKSKIDSDRLQMRLKSLLDKKAFILKNSLALSDTIRKQLDSLMPYTDKEAQQRFNTELDSLLAKKGCKDESKGPVNY